MCFFSMQDEDLIQGLHERGIPAVIVNGREPLMRLDAVAPANRTGGYLGAHHLVELGHRRILTLSHSRRPTIRDRIAGSRKAMRETGIGEADDLTIDLEAMRSRSCIQGCQGAPGDQRARRLHRHPVLQRRLRVRRNRGPDGSRVERSGRCLRSRL
ncbi:hypothetical protein QW131_29280 [Roseibium salinum]|nr:hypothetical protein [Roseibium salinum]